MVYKQEGHVINEIQYGRVINKDTRWHQIILSNYMTIL